MKILIVEDDVSGVLLLKRYLQDQGETVIAMDGVKAVAAFLEARDSHRPFDLICLDIMLPHLGGQEVLKRIRSLEDEVGIGGSTGCKVILLTALRDVESITLSFRNQREAHLSKPISKERLFREIRMLGLPVTDDA